MWTSPTSVNRLIPNPLPVHPSGFSWALDDAVLKNRKKASNRKESRLKRGDRVRENWFISVDRTRCAQGLSLNQADHRESCRIVGSQEVTVGALPVALFRKRARC